VATWHEHTAHTPGSGGRLKDQPAGERPRERLIERGAQALSPAELVAILVRTGLQGVNAVEIGKQLVCKFGSLGAMARASVDDLRSVPRDGRAMCAKHPARNPAKCLASYPRNVPAMAAAMPPNVRQDDSQDNLAYR